MAGLGEELEALAKACVKAEPENDFELDDDPWQHLSELVEEDAEAALSVARRITELTDDVHMLSVLGAGPIEELLRQHPATLDAVLLEARRSPSFRKAFRCVWTGGLAPAVKAKADEVISIYGGNL